MKLEVTNQDGTTGTIDAKPLVFDEDLREYEDKEGDLVKKAATPSAYVALRRQWVQGILSRSQVELPTEIRMTAAQVNRAWHALYWGSVKVTIATAVGPNDPND